MLTKITCLVLDYVYTFKYLGAIDPIGANTPEHPWGEKTTSDFQHAMLTYFKKQREQMTEPGLVQSAKRKLLDQYIKQLTHDIARSFLHRAAA